MRDNLTRPYLLMPGGFRYRNDLKVTTQPAESSSSARAKSTVDGTCEEGQDVAYLCALGGQPLLKLENGCREGQMHHLDRSYSLRAWFEGGYHIGYLVYDAQEGQLEPQPSPKDLVGVFRIEDPFARPVWVPEGSARGHRIAMELLAAIVDRLVDVETSAGYPFLCEALAPYRPVSQLDVDRFPSEPTLPRHAHGDGRDR